MPPLDVEHVHLCNLRRDPSASDGLEADTEHPRSLARTEPER